MFPGKLYMQHPVFPSSGWLPVSPSGSVWYMKYPQLEYRLILTRPASLKKGSCQSSRFPKQLILPVSFLGGIFGVNITNHREDSNFSHGISAMLDTIWSGDGDTPGQAVITRTTDDPNHLMLNWLGSTSWRLHIHNYDVETRGGAYCIFCDFCCTEVLRPQGALMGPKWSHLRHYSWRFIDSKICLWQKKV